MNMNTALNSEHALHTALIYAGIEKEEFDCLLQQYEDGLYHFLLRTYWMKYEFYVEDRTGEILGIQTEPLVYREVLDVCGSAGAALSAVA